MIVAIGNRVRLRLAELRDREPAWTWMAHSDLTADTLGPPMYADRSAPAFDAFCDDHPPFLFDGTQPFDGRALIIQANGLDIGFLGYRQINLLHDVVELDIWLASRALAGQGHGSEALQLACGWMQRTFGVNRFVLRPSRRNVRALRAVRRAGFRETDLQAHEVASKLALPRGDYADEVLLFRSLPLPPVSLAVDPQRVYIFIDSEFTNLTEPRLISLGAVATDATAFYCELSDWPRDACSEFVRMQVLPLLDGDAVPHPVAAESLARWLAERSERAPVTVVSDSGFDRWAISDLLGREDLPSRVEWLRVPVAPEELDAVASELRLRRHHALDDARALRYAVLSAHGNTGNIGSTPRSATSG